MKDLTFWQAKYLKAFQDFRLHRSKVFIHQRFYKPIKLRKLQGHKLNRDYTGWKIQARRKLALVRRSIVLTKAAEHRKEMIRLARTKLAFFAARIENLGGQVEDRLDWLYLIKT